MTNYTKELIKAIKASDGSALDDLKDRNVILSIDEAGFSGDQIGAIEISSISCANTEWEACIFEGTKFTGVDFRGAYFNSCSFHSCVFENCIFVDSSFEGCVFKSSALRAVADAEALEMSGCQLEDSELSGIHFVDTTLSVMKMTSGRLADIDGAGVMTSVSLRNVVVERVNTAEMELTTCTGAGCSVLPAGFRAVSGARRRV